MAALSYAFIFYNLHRIRYSIGEHIASFYHVTDFNFHCTGYWRIYSRSAYSYVVAALRSFADLSYTSICSCQYSAPWKYFRSK
jgi:hypothetical protein